MIPFIDFGGAGPYLHFAAANGYPPGAYRPLVETLTPRYRVCSMLFRLHSATLKRQRVFESAKAAYEHYRRKPVFSRMGDDHLRLCTESLVRPRADGKVELAFPPEWEARIYAVGPLMDWQLWREIKNLRPPLLIVRGGEPEPGWPDAAAKIKQRLPHTVIRTVAGGGHLAPLEKPDEVGEAIQEFLR